MRSSDQISPEFAHDLHEHGLNDEVVGAARDSSASARRKCKNGSSNGNLSGSGGSDGGDGDGDGHERLPRLGLAAPGIIPAAARAAAAATAALIGQGRDSMSVDEMELESGGLEPLSILHSPWLDSGEEQRGAAKVRYGSRVALVIAMSGRLSDGRSSFAAKHHRPFLRPHFFSLLPHTNR